MAERRMFAKTIIDSDAFLDMPITAQALYFHLGMRADDDGFVNNAKRITRAVGCKDGDLKHLINSKFVIQFPSGVIVIKHWRINNYIQKDRKKSTTYTEEMAMLSIEDNGAYTLRKHPVSNGYTKQDTNRVQNVSNLDTERIQNGYSLDSQISIGKDSIDYSLSSTSSNNNISPPYPPKKQEKGGEREDFSNSSTPEISQHSKPSVTLTSDQYSRLAGVFGQNNTDRAITALSDGITSGRLQKSTNSFARLQRMLQNGLDAEVKEQSQSAADYTPDDGFPTTCPHCGKPLNSKGQCTDCGIEILSTGIGWEEQRIASAETKAAMADQMTKFLARAKGDNE